MKLQIPDIGDNLTLMSDWTFTLHEERRNFYLWKLFTGKDFKWRGKEKLEVTLSKGTELIVDRVYIRNGAKDFSSLTFRIAKTDNKDLLKKRFWAKLADCNEMEISDIEFKDNIPKLIFGRIPYTKIGDRKCEYGNLEKDKDTGEWIEKIDYLWDNKRNTKYKVKIKIDYEEKEVLNWGYLFDKTEKVKVISKLHYTMIDLDGKILFETSSVKSLKKIAKEMFEMEWRGKNESI